MNKKQCPKCGEENPPEAVMCWACYTPLSGAALGGGAGTGAAASGGAPPATAHEDGEKKKIPPWQLGVIGVGLLLAVGIGVRSMMPAASNDETGIEIPATGMEDPAAPEGLVSPGPTTPTPSAPSQGGGSSIKPEPTPYKIVVPPSFQMSTATMAIVPTDASASGSQAASYAAYVRRQLPGEGKRWKAVYIYVFSDDKAAETFANFMRQRRGAPLSDNDFASLSSLWSSTLACYEYSPGSGKERVLYPSKNPSGWWYSRA